MRVLLLPRYDALGASSRLRMLQYVSALRAHGLQVDIAPLLGDGYVEDLYAGRVSKWKVLRAYANRLLRLRTASTYDAIWIEKELFPWLPAWFERALLPKGAAVVVDYDDAVFHRYDQHPLAGVRWLLGKKIDRLMRAADLVTVGNGYLGSRARAAGAHRVEWLPTVIDLQRYPLPSAVERRCPIVIGWIGSPATAHYLQQVTPALRTVAAIHPIRCVAIGARADQLADTPFEPWTWTEDSEVELLHRFDAGIMPLPDEPWERGKCGYKLIQYMACGLPVVASPVGVNADIVQAEISGELADSTTEWVQALTRLVLDVDLRRRRGAAGRRRVEEIYSVQAQSARLAGLLKSVTPRSGH